MNRYDVKLCIVCTSSIENYYYTIPHSILRAPGAVLKKKKKTICLGTVYKFQNSQQYTRRSIQEKTGKKNLHLKHT